MKNPFRLQLCFSLLLSYVKSDPFCMSPNPQHYQEVNSDGSVTPLMKLVEDTGDIYEETLEGYRVESIGGIYKYLEVDPLTEVLADSGLLAGKDNPNIAIGKSGNKLKKHVRKNKRNAGRMKGYKEPKRHNQIENDVEQAAGIPKEHRHYGRRANTNGIVKNLVVPFKFSNHRNRPVPSIGDLNILMNNNGPHPLCPTGSVKDVYLISSYGQLQLESFVTPWVVLPETEAYYANGSSGLAPLGKSQEMIRDALNALEDMWFDFRPFDVNHDGYVDAIAFLHSGYSAEWGGNDAFGTYYKNRIWSHKWTLYQLPMAKWISQKTGVKVYNYHVSPALWGTSGNNIGRIGVIAHETGHFFGLPDLYDFDGGGNGIGSFGLMASCWGFDNSQYYPPHMSPWSKIQLGWVVPSIIRYSGRYAIKRSCDHPSAYIVKNNFPMNEYLLIENRQKCHFDSDMTGVGGLAVYHIDENASYNTEGFPGQTQWPKNGNHYRVALVQADGKYDLERGNNRGDGTDLFHSNGISGLGPRGTYSSKGIVNAYPNTNAYQGGVIQQTGVSINQISQSGDVMTFTVTLGSQTSSLIEAFSSQQQSQFELILQTDNRGFETGWELIQLDSLNGTFVVDHRSSHTYKNNERYVETVSLGIGVYEFIITDLSGDGICCGQGTGSYAIILDNVTVISSGGIFGSKEVTYFTVGTTAGSGNINDDEEQWLADVEDKQEQSIEVMSSTPSPSPVNITSIPPVPNGVEDLTTKQRQQDDDNSEGWTVISYDDFENGLGNFGYGDDESPSTFFDDDATINVYAHQGMSALILHDKNNTENGSAMLSSAEHKGSYDVTMYNQIRVSFWYFTLLAPSKDHRLLFLEYSADGGDNWSVVQAFPLLNDGNSPQFYEATSVLDRHLVVFSNHARLRFRFDLIVRSSGYSGIKDVSIVFIDEVEFSGK